VPMPTFAEAPKAALHPSPKVTRPTPPTSLFTGPTAARASAEATFSRPAHVFSRVPVHPKTTTTAESRLSIGNAGDASEREADRLSQDVVSMSGDHGRRARRLPTRGGPAPDGDPVPALPIVRQVLAAPGQMLDGATRESMEGRFGCDFSHVRVHSDGAAAESARRVDAHAYTVGRHVVFGEGRYAPGTQDGRRLIAHELTHVLQQSGRANGLHLQRQPAVTKRGRILSLEQIAADAAREKLRKRTGQTVAKACRSISAGAGKDNCVATLQPGLQVSIVRSLAGGAWLEVITPEQIPGFGPKEPVYVMAAFVEEAPASAAPAGGSKTGGPTVKDVLRLDQTIAIKGMAKEQPNYVDRAIARIESAPLGADLTLIPTTGTPQNGISILKGDFHLDDDPLAVSMGHNQVYRSREVAEAVVADLNRQTPGTPNYAYYLRDGIIFPTTLSATTIPSLIPFVRKKREQDLAGIKATGDLAKDVLWWYVGARFPGVMKGGGGSAPAKEAVKGAAKGSAAAKAAFDAAKVADELFAATKSIANPGEKMLAAGGQLSAMRGITAAEKVKVMLEYFKKIGFIIGKEGVVDDGARFIMKSDDGKYAFAFVKDTTEILYGKFDRATLKYVWRVMK
jgi:hypothetical protein